MSPVVILRTNTLQLAWSNQRLHFLEEEFVLFVSVASFHLVIEFGDDLVLKLQLDRAGVNNQRS